MTTLAGEVLIGMSLMRSVSVTSVITSFEPVLAYLRITPQSDLSALQECLACTEHTRLMHAQCNSQLSTADRMVPDI